MVAAVTHQVLAASTEDTFQFYFTAHATGTTTSSVYTSGSLAIGPAQADRYVVVVVTTQENADISAVTVGGIAASKLVDGIDTGSNPDMLGDIWWAAVPTGTSAVVTVTLSAADDQIGVSLFRVVGHSTTASDTDSASGSAASISLSALTVPAGGGAVLGFSNNTDTTATAWTGAYQTQDSDDGAHRHSSSLLLGTYQAVTPTFTAAGATANQVLVGAAFNRRGSANGGLDANVSLLLHFDGMDATTLFVDNGSAFLAPTVVNSAQVDTAQSKFGGSSLLLASATSDSLRYNGQAGFTFGTGDFAIDMWIRPASIGSTMVLYEGRPSGTNGDYPTLFLHSSGVMVYFTNGANRIAGTTVLSADTWYHVALTRSGTSTRLFVNGTQEGSTYSDSADYLTGGAGRPIIGRDDNAPSGTLQYNGWIDELRVSKGAARWTANFTPPARFYS